MRTEQRVDAAELHERDRDVPVFTVGPAGEQEVADCGGHGHPQVVVLAGPLARDARRDLRLQSDRRRGRRPGEKQAVALRCADDTLYCGWTSDVQRRLAAHRSGTASRYTRSRRPIELAVVISVADRSAALREEARIKRLSRAAKIQLIEASLDAA